MEKFWDILYGRDGRLLYNPFNIAQMGKAMGITVEAINKREKIMIFSSPETDNLCSVALIFLVLKYVKGDVEFFISPNSEEEDYETFKNYLECMNVNLLIVIGTEELSDAVVKSANKLDIKIIHIKNKATKRKNIVNINPRDKSSNYVSKNLSLSSTSFKFVQAISTYYNLTSVVKYLDLVAIGTLTSGKPLSGENKIFLDKGLEDFLNTQNKGLLSLIEEENITNIEEGIDLIVEDLTPSENSLGSKEIGNIILELLTTSDIYRAKQISKYLKTWRSLNIK